MGVRIGISISSTYRVADQRQGARHMIDRAKAANVAGLDSLFIGDHHAVPIPYYQNSPMMGRLLGEWDHRPAGALYLLPLWHPVLLAEQVATLACIAQGPFILQCALGADEYQFQAMSARLRHRPSAFEQSLECIRALWQGEAVSLNSRWQFKDVRIAPQPPSPIEVWIGASADIAIDRAVRLGDVWLAEPGMTLKESAGRMAVYQDALSRHQKAASRVAIRRDIYVAESSEDASATMDKVRKNGYRGFDPDALMIGEPAAIAQQIQAFESLGYTDIIIRNLHEDAEKALASTRRLALVKKLLAET